MKKGFTLIELLVVIAVIGMLASIVLVSLSGTRSKASLGVAKQFYSQVNHTLGADLAGRWSFEEGSGAIAKDASGNGNNGILYNSPVWQDAATCGLGFGGCLGLSGTAYGNRSSVSGLSRSSLTFTFWSKQTTTSTSFMHPIGIFGGHSATVYVSPGTFSYAYKFQTISGQKYEAGIATLDNNWHFFAVTFDGSTIRAYVDGVRKVNVSASGGIDGSDYSVFIGATGSGSSVGGNYFSGLIDEVSLYSQALTTAEIQKLYAKQFLTYQIATQTP